MKKLITALAGTSLLTMTLGLVGCGETSTVTTEKKEIKQTGKNPPSAETTTPAPPKE